MQTKLYEDTQRQHAHTHMITPLEPQDLPRTLLPPRSFRRASETDVSAQETCICCKLMLPSGQEKGRRIDHNSSFHAIFRNRMLSLQCLKKKIKERKKQTYVPPLFHLLQQIKYMLYIVMKGKYALW